MDAIGNKLTQSEKFNSEGNKETYTVKFIQVGIYYTVFEKGNSYSIHCPTDGFLNIIFPESSSPCICPYFINQSSYIIRGGDNIIHYIRKNDVLDWKNQYGHSTAIAVFIPQELLVELKFKFLEDLFRYKKGLLTKADNRIALIANQILTCYQQPLQLNQLRIQSLLIEALVHQIEGLFIDNEKPDNFTNKSLYDKIRLVKDIIDEDLSINYTISELAQKVGTNDQYLKKYFKQYVGKTVMNYIIEQKMIYAKELIKSGKYRMVDVARLTGYKHATHFTTAFKKYYGFIPNSLRYS